MPTLKYIYLFQSVIFGAYLFITYRENKTDESESDHIHLALVICGKAEFADQAMPTIKSAILMSKSKLTFHVVIEDETKRALQRAVLLVD